MSLGTLEIISLVVQYLPVIQRIITTATSNSEISDKITGLAPEVGELIGNLGSQLFPKSSTALQQVGAAIAAFDPNTVMWIQKSTNSILKLALPLEVDGIYGAQTRAAVERLQGQLGLSVDGIAGKVTQAAITAVLTK